MIEQIKKFIFQKKTSSLIRLFPKNSSRGTVVISYLTWPFCEGHNSVRARGHTNAFEVVTIAEIYQELGYTVEVVDYDNNNYLPPKDCSLAIDLHGQLARWNKTLPKNCLRILHATGAHWSFANEAEQARLAAIKKRRGVALAPRRQVPLSPSAELADQIVVLGNEFTMQSFAFANKPITRIPISSAYEFSWPKNRDFSLAKKKFLWLGSYGMVHKGLDLALEAFAQMPELRLTICGRPEKEEDFFKLYEKELLHTPNIKLHGWIDMASTEFLEIAATHAGIIYPSCSEGGGGCVIHCMHAGMIPLCTREASVDLQDFGMFINDGTVEAVVEAARKIAALPDEEVERRARFACEHVRVHHTREEFKKNYRSFAVKMIETIK
ncbi:MAG: glycosyltransferase [Chthoniobacterales bacterium]